MRVAAAWFGTMASAAPLRLALPMVLARASQSVITFADAIEPRLV